MMRARRRPLALVAACLGLAAIAGCSSASSTPPAGTVKAAASPSVSYMDSVSEVSPAAQPASTQAAPSPVGVNVAAFNALARQEATTWARSSLAKVWRTGLVLLDPRSHLRPEQWLPLGRGRACLRRRRARLRRAAPVGTAGRRRHLVRRFDHERWPCSARRGRSTR
jgi:hypothetical protein